MTNGERLEREAREDMEEAVREEIAERRESGDRLLDELERLRRVLQGEQAKLGAPPPAHVPPVEGEGDEDDHRRRHWWQR